MPLDDLVKRMSVPAVLVGVAAVALTPVILRSFSNGGRPLAKTLLHKYLDMADKLKEVGAETHEQWRDLLAEVQSERESRQATEVASATSEATAEM